jgi:flagellar basal body rod protein FlgG
MSTGIWAAASGAVAQTNALDVAANNIANASTPGFRADRELFRETLANATGQGGDASLRYSVVRSVRPDLNVGQIVSTNRGLDVALRGPEGLFVVSTPQGERYTRAGHMNITADGTLTTADGKAYLGADRKPLRVPPGSGNVTFGPDGSLLVDGVDSGSKLGVVSFRNQAGLEKEGDILMRARPEAGRAMPAAADLEVGALELSNSSAIAGMTSLVTASRSFEMLTKVIEAFSQADRSAATSIMKP